MLNVLMVAAENDALPQGKVGGIGDVIRDIPKFLANRNVNVDVLVPSYGFQTSANPSKKVLTLDVQFRGNIEQVDLYKLEVEGDKLITQWVLDHPGFCIGEPGQVYFNDGGNKPFHSDAIKFALFCAATCELVANHWFDKVDMLHLHDWHSAIVAILRAYDPKYKILKSKRTIYSVHNLALQGIRPFDNDESSLKAWFPDLAFDYQTIRDPRYPDCYNPTRAAINLSNAVHVVSPTYAKEVMKPTDHNNGFVGGEALENDLINANEENRLFGFLNGCDYDFVPPEPVSFEQLLQEVKASLLPAIEKNNDKSHRHQVTSERSNTWLNNPHKGPTLLSIGRLTDQKLKLLLLPHHGQLVIDSVMDELKKFDSRLIILGSGDNVMEDQIADAMLRHDNLLFINGYFENLSQQLYVNTDLFLMPSSFEPCGISQMLSMRAGQPCLAHRIGGLADTIKHCENGFLFYGNTYHEQVEDMLHTLASALNMIVNRQEHWQEMQSNAKAQRFLWSDSINQYIRYLYNQKCYC